MTPEERYAALVEDLVGSPGESQVELASSERAPEKPGGAPATPGSEDSRKIEPPSTGPRRIGSTSVKINGKMFAMLSRGRFVVKLPAKRVDELASAGQGEHYDAGNGRIQKEWLSVAPGAEDDWLPLAREAMAFVGGATKTAGR
jgi:hypothetical protein